MLSLLIPCQQGGIPFSGHDATFLRTQFLTTELGTIEETDHTAMAIRPRPGLYAGRFAVMALPLLG